MNCSQPSIDLSRDGKPCFGENGTATGTAGDDAHYNGYTFTDEAVSIIDAFANTTASSSSSSAKRLFIYFAIHNTHSPTQAPLRIQQRYRRFAAWPKQQVFVSTCVTRALRWVGAFLRSCTPSCRMF